MCQNTSLGLKLVLRYSAIQNECPTKIQPFALLVSQQWKLERDFLQLSLFDNQSFKKIAYLPFILKEKS